MGCARHIRSLARRGEAEIHSRPHKTTCPETVLAQACHGQRFGRDTLECRSRMASVEVNFAGRSRPGMYCCTYQDSGVWYNVSNGGGLQIHPCGSRLSTLHGPLEGSPHTRLRLSPKTQSNREMSPDSWLPIRKSTGQRRGPPGVRPARG